MADIGEIKLRFAVLGDKEYVAGDIVELKSGGPDMTVLGQCEDCGEVEVAWFSFDDEAGFIFESETFPAAALKLSEDGDP